MGLLVNGVWQDQWYDTKATGGRFVRKDAKFRHHIEADPSARFPAASGRYHLYVSYACPWAHRTLIARALKGLDEHVAVSVVEPLMLAQGWEFSDDRPDHLHGARCLHEVYTRSAPDFSGRVTVPVLWDTQTQTIVNNESSEILRMLDQAFAGVGARTDVELWPAALRDELEAVNERVYHDVNNGVYRAGFATTQAAYDEAVTALFSTLDWLDERLAGRRYLVGDRATEADWRLFTTLVRFDAVYHGHFKCNRRRIADYPNLSGYLRDLYQVPGVAATVSMDDIVQHYHRSHESINPHRIVPIGPVLDLDAPHGRGALG